LRVLLSTPDYPPATGGIQILLERLVGHSRHDFDVITLDRARWPARARRAGSVTYTPRLGRQALDVAVLNALTVRRALSTRPDAVVSGHVVTGPAVLAAQALLGAPAIQYLHGKELGGRPQLSRYVVLRSRALVAVSSFTRERVLALGARPENVHTILPGVDAPAAAPPAHPRSPGGVPTVVTVARLEDRYKGFDVMLRALPLIRERVGAFRWVLIGAGSLRDELEGIASAFGVGDLVQFAGGLDDAGRDGWLDRADVFAMPSRLMPGDQGGEGFGIVYLEAAMHRLPSVAGNRDGAVDAVLDGVTGVTVDPTSHAAVADAIADLLLDPERRARLGDAGRARAERLTWARMAQQVDRVIEGAVAGRTRHRRLDHGAGDGGSLVAGGRQ
jgi:phosphatidylinositol alpha-1,6-mannosyltransferase